MRSVKTIVIALAVALCAFGALSAQASAAKPPKEPTIFGKFVASATGSTKGHGEVYAMRLGPYTFTGKNLGGGNGFGPICEKELKSKGNVVAGESETFFQEVKFAKCYATRKSAGSEEAVAFNFSLGMEFHSNGSAEIGEGDEAEVKITRPSTVTIKGSKSSCEVIIPAQTIPISAEKHPEREYEAASYLTEEESLAGEKSKEKKYGPVRKRLDIEMIFKKIKTEEQLNPAKGCTNESLEEGAKYKPETDTVEYNNGILEAELEEITLNDGNLSFEPAGVAVS